MYFHQLLGAACTQSWSKYFFDPLSTFFLLMLKKYLENKLTKKVENGSKSISTSFRLRAAPESWSKYKTKVLLFVRHCWPMWLLPLICVREGNWLYCQDVWLKGCAPPFGMAWMWMCILCRGSISNTYVPIITKARIPTIFTNFIRISNTAYSILGTDLNQSFFIFLGPLIEVCKYIKQ